MKPVYKLCGRKIENVDYYSTIETRQTLDKLMDLLPEMEILLDTKDGNFLKLNDYKIHPENLYIEDTTGKKVNFYDTLDDDGECLVLDRSRKSLTTYKFRVNEYPYEGMVMDHEAICDINNNCYNNDDDCDDEDEYRYP